MLRLKRLNKNLSSMLKATSLKSMYDNDRCDIEAVTNSCFASEKCTYNTSGTNLDIMLNCDYSYVIINEKNEFVGCICANKCQGSVPFFEHIKTKKNALFVHTLCVDKNYRGRGLAKKLLNKIKSKSNVLYLTVLSGKNGANENFSSFFKNRHNNLLKFYSKNGFSILDKTKKFTLMNLYS